MKNLNIQSIAIKKGVINGKHYNVVILSHTDFYIVMKDPEYYCPLFQKDDCKAIFVDIETAEIMVCDET